LERTVEMIIEGNNIQRHPVEAAVPQGSPVSTILNAIYTSGLIQWVEEYISVAEVLSFVYNLGWVVIRCNVNPVGTILERCAAQSIEWASIQGLQLGTSETEAALFTPRQGHRKLLRPKLTVKITVRNGII